MVSTSNNTCLRCAWAEINDRERVYHDTEWGIPEYNDQKLFEMLCLEGAQAGLSWDTILKKRDGYRAVFYDFDITRCAMLTDDELEIKRYDERIVRNRLKVYSVRKNAQAVQKIIAEHGSFANFLWAFVDDTPVDSTPKTISDVPVSTDVSDAMSKTLKKYGCSFVGSTICYAFMQATGMVNDHVIDCWRRNEV